MQPSRKRSVVVYGIVGIALLGAIILGVQFAKNRSEQIAAGQQGSDDSLQQAPVGGNQNQNGGATNETAGQPNATPPTTTSNSDGGSTESAQSQPQQGSQPQPTTAPATGGATLGVDTQGIRVPETGLGDTLLGVLGVAAVSFSAVVYGRSRRRLRSLD